MARAGGPRKALSQLNLHESGLRLLQTSSAVTPASRTARSFLAKRSCRFASRLWSAARVLFEKGLVLLERGGGLFGGQLRLAACGVFPSRLEEALS